MKPTSLYVGIRAFESHSPVRATLADRDRDRVSADDDVELLRAKDVDFLETSRVNRTSDSANLDLGPTRRLRVEATRRDAFRDWRTGRVLLRRGDDGSFDISRVGDGFVAKASMTLGGVR